MKDTESFSTQGHRFRLKLAFCLLSACLFSGILHSYAQPRAFPGALGFGANATGGRNGIVYHVTTLADSGPGSFRDAVSHSGRIVVFDVGGYINLNTAVSVQGNMTIAGQTAPGGGIGFRGGEISFASRNNIICRYIRILPGSETTTWEDDALSLYRATNVICDHVSLEFGPYNNIDAVSDDWQNHPVTAVTFQNCIIADPSRYVAASSHDGQQFGAHTECVNGQMSWFYNIFANSHNRNPLAKINTVFINNVLYNCSAGYTTHTSTEFDHDIVNNYFIAGPASSSSNFPWYQVDNNQSIYYTGNLYDSDRNGLLGGSTTTPVWYQGGSGGTVLSAPWSSLTTSVPILPTAAGFRYTVSSAGAWPRSAVDNLVVSQVKTLGKGVVGTGAGTTGPDGGLYSSQLDTGFPNNGYGNISGGTPALDADQDGMPDYWERAVGLNPAANDAMTIAADGYANIEHYLNWLADPHALTDTNTSVDVELFQYTSGFTNVSPVYTLDNASNGVVSLLANNHVAEFTPATGFQGLASFRFLVVGSDGSAYSNTVNVLVSPVTQSSDLTWAGDGTANNWETDGDANFLKNGLTVPFGAGDNVTFDDNGSSSPSINIPASVVVGDMFVAADKNYTFGGNGSVAATGALLKSGGGTLQMNLAASFLSGVSVSEGVLQLGDGISANGSVTGGITNDATILFANPYGLTSSASISGSGALTKNGAGTLTLSGNQTYSGLTTINGGILELAGTAPAGDIDDNAALTFKPSSSFGYSGTISGTGTLTMNGSGQALILSGANTYSGGTTNVGGNLVLVNDHAAGTGPVTLTSGSVLVGNNVVISNGFTVINSTSDLNMACTNGTGTWAGRISAVGGAQWRPGSDGGTFIFTGDAPLGSQHFIVPRGTVYFASNAYVAATGSATSLGRDNTNGKRSSRIHLEDNATLQLGLCSMGGGKAGSYIVVTIQDNASLSTGANNFDLHNINRTDAGTTTALELNGGSMTAGGFTKTRTGSEQLSTINLNGGILRAGANNTSYLPVLSGLTVNVQAGGAIIDDAGFAVTISQPLVHDAGLGSAADGGLTKLGSGTLTLTGINTFSGPVTVSAGMLALSGSGTIPGTADITVEAGASLDVSGTSSGGIAVGSGKTLSGNGATYGNVTITNNAVLSPGGSIGRLTFNNDLILASGSTSVFEISGSPLSNDVAIVMGTVTLGGTLIVTNVGGALLPGASFKLIDAAGYNGSFNSLSLPSLDNGFTWDTNSLSSAGLLTVAGPPVVNSLTPLATGGYRLSFSGSFGQGYEIRATTNAALSPVTLWDLLDAGTFSSAPVIYDDSAATNFAERFYLIRVP